MPAYLVFDIDITDRNEFDKYVSLAKPTLAAFGAKIPAIADAPDVLEGEWSPPRVVIIEFESSEQARRWMSSPEYAKAKPMRHKSAKTNLVMVPGLT
jgi:uncharacterized protein (DUF1330 family)